MLGDDLRLMVRAEGEELERLEAHYQVSQKDSVNHLIEDTCWCESKHLAAWVGGKGSDEERLGAIRAAFDAEGVKP